MDTIDILLAILLFVFLVTGAILLFWIVKIQKEEREYKRRQITIDYQQRSDNVE